MKQAWRHVILGGAATGLALSPLIAPAGAGAATGLAVAGAAAILAWAARPGKGASSPAVAAWLASIALVAGVVGLSAGAYRLSAIDRQALRGSPGELVELDGYLASSPRLDGDGLAAELESENGRVLLRGADLEGLGAGAGVSARGRLVEPQPWRASYLERRGIATALEAERIEPTGGARGGVEGRVDAIRTRAERALERGMPDREAALARGFVLGQDDRIDAGVREDFRRSGLAHLLAVSGQNVILLCLLAWPLLALLSLTFRARLLALLFLIALYVPVTGAGPSIQRAAVMGGAGLVAALADRPPSRWYALLLAATLTLALNPRASGDVGWQLSFAAVGGILLWSGRLASLLAAGAQRGSVRRAGADGVAMTIAATVATAPLMAHHFEALSIAALPANVLALPAVAPAMWLGMLAGSLGQVPAVPVEPLNWLNSLCLAYVGQVSHWFGSPAWAQLDLGLESPLLVAAAYATLLGLAELALRAGARRSGLAWPRARGARRAAALVAATSIAALLAFSAAGPLRAESPEPAPDALVVRVLDVGQGDAILLDPPGGDPILVDAGPPGGGVAARLDDLGVEALGALVLTHDQSDHAGGAAAVLRSANVARVIFADGSRRLITMAEVADAVPLGFAEGGELRSGDLRLSVLWPPRALLGLGGEDPNRLSLVLLAEWRHFSMLLTGDAEAELAPIESGPFDVLKVAHHGSEDEGLSSLLEQAVPKLAVISVGQNPYGHPAPPTLAELAEHHVPALRTDAEGEIVIEADRSGWSVEGT